jgi:heptosyltransferase I
VAAILAEARLPLVEAFSLCGRLSLTQLAGALARARLFITIDTGVLHLAAALDAPTLALHGPTRSSRWGGCSRTTFSLNAPHPDAGYLHLGFEKHPHATTIMQTLTVDAVSEAALGLLARPVHEPAPVLRPEPSYAQ